VSDDNTTGGAELDVTADLFTFIVDSTIADTPPTVDTDTPTTAGPE